MSARVGIFWDDGEELIASAVPVADGIDDSLFVNGPHDHDPYWAVLTRSRPHLRPLAHLDQPRGRVLLDRSTGRYRVLLDEVLDTAPNRARIHARFELPGDTVFQSDLHYTTDPKTLACLFGCADLEHGAHPLPSSGVSPEPPPRLRSSRCGT